MKLEKQHPSVVTLWDDLKQVPPITPVQAKQPQGISRQLKSFQLEGLDWMMRQEKTPYKGGLLGDEMGMGKTIQAVSLLMSDYPVGKPSLVVVPPVALMQWQSEIKVRCPLSSTSVFHALTFSFFRITRMASFEYWCTITRTPKSNI